MPKKIDQLSEVTNPADSVRLVISDDGVTSKKVTKGNFLASLKTYVDNLIAGLSSLYVGRNSSIAPGTGTKITADAKGLVTGIQQATTDDIAESATKKYVPATQLTAVNALSGTNTGDQDMSGFVTRKGKKLQLKGQDYKFVGVNYYPLFWSSKETVVKILDTLQRRNVQVVRAWLFDSGKPPSDSAGNFRFLDYPVDLNNNVINNFNFESPDDFDEWTQTAATFSISTEQAYNGSQSVKHVAGSSTYESMRSDLLTVAPNTEYTLTFYYYQQSRSGFGPVLRIRKGSDDAQILDGGLLEGSSGNWVRKQVRFNTGSETSITIQIQNWGGAVTMFYDYFCLNISGTPVLTVRESQMLQMDMVVAEAEKRGIKIIASFADNTSNYLTKLTYIQWANAINNAGLSTSFPYIGFFTSPYAKDLYKSWMATVLNRKNTITGRIYKNDPTFFSWELGNELRLDRDDPSGINTLSSANLALLSFPGGWADEMSTYLKVTLGARQLVTFGSMSHLWKWVAGDNVANGTYYGVSYDIMSALPNIDYLDVHNYPTQLGDGTQLMKYGQHLGYPNAISGDGYRAQLAHWVSVGHANNKPVIMTEIGFPLEVVTSNTYYPLYPRHEAFRNIFQDWFDIPDGADGMCLWSATIVGGGSYSVNFGDTGGEGITNNSNDTILTGLIEMYNNKFNHHIAQSEKDFWAKYAPSEYKPLTYDGEWAGIVQQGYAGETLSFGNLCYLDNANSQWKKADADLSDAYDKRLGICVQPAGSGKATKMLVMGVVRADSLYPTLSPGDPVYMSQTAGNITATKPTASGAVERIIGFANSADELFFWPSSSLELKPSVS